MLRHLHVGREQLVAFQNERLGRVLEHGYRNVAYYRGLFVRHKLEPHDIRTAGLGWLLHRQVAWFYAS